MKPSKKWLEGFVAQVRLDATVWHTDLMLLSGNTVCFTFWHHSVTVQHAAVFNALVVSAAHLLSAAAARAGYKPTGLPAGLHLCSTAEAGCANELSLH